MSVITGRFAGSGSTGNQSVTGVGFRPTGILFFCSDEVATTTRNNTLYMYGGTDGSNEFCVGISSRDSSMPMQNAVWNRNDYCIMIANYAATLVGTANIVSFDSDGFTINWVTATTKGIKYIAFGGGWECSVNEVTVAASDSSPSYTGVGFQPDFMFFFGGSQQTTSNVLNTTDDQITMGWTDGTNMMLVALFNEDAANPTNMTSNLSTSYCFADYEGAGSLTNRWAISSFDSDGWTVTQTSSGNDVKVHYFALKGAVPKMDTDTAYTSTGNNSYTGAGFSPNAGFVVSSGRESVGVLHGVFSDSYDGMIGNYWRSGDTSSILYYYGDTDEVWKDTYNLGSLIDSQANHVSMDADGFTWNWSDAATSTYTMYLILFQNVPLPANSVNIF